jgi:hypothetical protein
MFVSCRSQSESDSGADIKSAISVSEPIECNIWAAWDLKDNEVLYAEIKGLEENDWHQVRINYLTNKIVFVFCDPGDQARLTYQFYY